MKNLSFKLILVAILTVVIVTYLPGCAGSDRTEPQSEQQSEATDTEAHLGNVQSHAEGDTHSMAAGGSDYLYTTDELYTCSMHPEVVTASADAKCPICNMNLTRMSEDAITQLRASNPKGCTMCKIIVPGDSEMNRCPSCNMDLMPITHDE